MQLSKSDYMTFLKHPAWMWIKKHEPKKLPAIDPGLQAMFDAGNVFEDYAEQLFPGAVELGFSNYESYKSLPPRTTQALENGASTIFQGRFEYGQLTFICDVLQVVDGKTVDLIEIKSSTGAKLDHQYDLAFQKYVLEGCGFTVRNISVVHVDNTYVRHGEIDIDGLTAQTDVTDEVNALGEFTKENVAKALQTLEASECPDMSPSLCGLGSYKDWVGIYKAINNIGPGSMYDICSLNPRMVGELERLQVSKLVDIPDSFPLNSKQAMQLRATKKGSPIIDTKRISEFMDTLQYPLYFFDYETLSGVIPYFDGMQPYKQYVFQYSLHVLDKPGGELRHMEYLHTENSNPIEPLSKTLQGQIGETGSVITWNMGFEKACNTTNGEFYPEYAEFYEKLNHRIVDLMTPFSSGWYADGGFKGSASIKNVLPVMSPKLSHKDLEISDGGSAQRLWMEAVLDGKHPNDKQKILDDLLEYCKLDTLAMVEIYKVLLSVPR